MACITINGITFDPETDLRDLSRAGLEHQDCSRSDYVLVQVTRPLRRSDREALAAAGARLLELVPTLTYLCHFPDADPAPLRELSFVSWAHPFLRDFKISPGLLDLETHGEDLVAIAGREPAGGSRRRPIEVLLHPGVDVDTVADRIARAGTGRASKIRVAAGKVKLQATPRKIAAIADIDEVRGIEVDAEAEASCNVAGSILGSSPVHQTLDLRGQGEIVAICDTGFDKGSSNDTHPAFSGRIRKIHARGGRPADDPDGHGTHCAGCIVGDGTSSLEAGAVTGTAPAAELVVQAVFMSNNSRLGGLPEDLRELFQEAFDDGARVHSNSWVRTDVGNRYNADCFEIDDFVWSHRDFVVVCSIGNSAADGNRNGIVDNRTVLPPGVAKNCISVGASESEREEISRTWGHRSMNRRFRAEPLRSDKWADNREGMAAFSGRGPAPGDRLSPDLVAPGTAILSTLSRRARARPLWGPTSDPGYWFLGGTSAATALASGCAAVARQFLRGRLGHPPSAALVKALLINGARPLRGQFVPAETHRIPNHSEGWGRIDLQRSVEPQPSERIELRDEADALDTGEERVHSFAVETPGHALTATLVWTDPAGESLQNDLDLIVDDGRGNERHGNARAGSDAFDQTNNVEQVVWPDFATGACNVTVRARRVAIHPQPFALVVRGALAS